MLVAGIQTQTRHARRRARYAGQPAGSEARARTRTEPDTINTETRHPSPMDIDITTTDHGTDTENTTGETDGLALPVPPAELRTDELETELKLAVYERERARLEGRPDAFDRRTLAALEREAEARNLTIDTYDAIKKARRDREVNA